jgi:hypothetical protein
MTPRARHASVGPLGSIAIAVLAWGVLAPCASATTIPYKNLNQLVAESAVIVIGRVTGMSYELSDKDKQVYTRVRLELLKPIKGEQHVRRLARGLSLSFLGGLSKDGRTVLEIAGMPRLQLARTYVVFLRAGKWTMNPITGWHQGVFEAVAAGGTGSQMLVSPRGEVVMGVDDGRLVLKALPARVRKPSAEPGEDALRLELKQSKEELERVTESLKDSIYREDNEEALERQDDARDNAPTTDVSPRRQGDRRRVLHEMLGGAPMALDDFISAVQAIDRRARTQPGRADRAFQLEPTPLTGERRALPPPPAAAETEPRRP